MKKMMIILEILILCGLIKSLIIANGGYLMYMKVLKENNIEKVIEKIRVSNKYVNIRAISEKYIEEVIKVEDKRFRKHKGFDVISILRAAYNNLMARKIVQGGSTITQQVVKNIFLTTDRTMERKVAEILMAMKIEKMYSKEEILELYCNITYLGEGCYGIKDAAKHYYGVMPKNLNENQIKVLVFSFRNPFRHNPNAIKIH